MKEFREQRTLLAMSFFSMVVFSVLIVAAAEAQEASIAYCPDDDQFGVGIADTKAAAQRLAIQRCERGSKSGCCAVEATTGSDRCIALAYSTEHYATGSGDTRATAKAAALEGCEDDECFVAASPCSD